MLSRQELRHLPYYYWCPECYNTLSPRDNEGNEILGRKCCRNSKHQNNKPVNMGLVRNPEYKGR